MTTKPARDDEHRVGILGFGKRFSSTSLSLNNAVLGCFLLLVGCTNPLVGTGRAAVRNVDAINAALKAAAPGDTILVKNGLYRDARLTLSASGQEGKWVTLAAETPGRVTFTGRSRITLAGQYQHVTGFVFQKKTSQEQP